MSGGNRMGVGRGMKSVRRRVIVPVLGGKGDEECEGTCHCACAGWEGG